MFTTYIYFTYTEQIMLLLLQNTLNGLFGNSFIFFNRDGDTNDDGSYKEIPLVASSGKRVMRRECAVRKYNVNELTWAILSTTQVAL